MASRTHWRFHIQPTSYGTAALACTLLFCLFTAASAHASDGAAKARWIEEGEKQERLGDYASAVNAYTKALQGDGALDVDIFITLGRVHRVMAKYKDAIAWIERAQEVYDTGQKSSADLNASILHEFGSIYFYQGDHERAVELAERALAIRLSQSPRNRRDVAASLNLKGLLLRDNNKFTEARAVFEEALATLADVPYPQDRAQVYTNLGALDYYEAKYSDAVTRFRKAVEIMRRTLAANHSDIGATLNNLAVMYQELGDLEKAAATNEEALKVKIANYGTDSPHVAATLHNMGRVAGLRGNFKRARALYERSLDIYQKEFGDEHQHVAANLTHLGLLASRADDHGQAIDQLQRAVDIMEKIHGADSTWVAEPMISLASASAAIGDVGEAHSLFLRSIRIAAKVNERQLLADACAAYADHLASQGQTPAAILFGKLAVRAIESVRAELTPLGAALNRSYLGEREPVYRILAQRMINADRLGEASNVLQLLKYDEYLRFAHSPLTARANENRLVLSPMEAAVKDQLDDINTKRLISAIESLPDSNVGTADRDGEMTRELAANAVRIQYLVEGDKLSAIVTGARSRFAASVAVSEVSLHAAVSGYQRALRNPRSNPFPYAQQLYAWMLQPLEEELSARNIDTLLVSLDGPLRYIPVAAIHDGERWVAENFRTIRYSNVSQTARSQVPKRSTMAAFGVSKAEGFAPLPRVADELAALVKSSPQDTSGILPGQLYLDDEFTLDNFVAALSSGHSLIHLASHFVLQPGSLNDSYLVIGGGVRLTLEDLRASDHTFDNTQLLTLSACNTAAATENAFGREIDGLGMLAQEKGARAVLASLWSVADRSTQRFMQTFYRLHASERMTVSDALRVTQMSMISGRRAGTNAAADYRLASARSRATPYAHPFYWAPFVLMQAVP